MECNQKRKGEGIIKEYIIVLGVGKISYVDTRLCNIHKHILSQEQFTVDIENESTYFNWILVDFRRSLPCI